MVPLCYSTLTRGTLLENYYATLQHPQRRPPEPSWIGLWAHQQMTLTRLSRRQHTEPVVSMAFQDASQPPLMLGTPPKAGEGHQFTDTR